jgi:hypothetical protein
MREGGIAMRLKSGTAKTEDVLILAGDARSVTIQARDPATQRRLTMLTHSGEAARTDERTWVIPRRLMQQVVGPAFTTNPRRSL